MLLGHTICKELLVLAQVARFWEQSTIHPREARLYMLFTTLIVN